MVVDPNGSWLASAGYGGKVRIWDPATGSVRRALSGHPGGVRWLVVAPDGSWLASAGRAGIAARLCRCTGLALGVSATA